MNAKASTNEISYQAYILNESDYTKEKSELKYFSQTRKIFEITTIRETFLGTSPSEPPFFHPKKHSKQYESQRPPSQQRKKIYIQLTNCTTFQLTLAKLS
jgi:hypothetical protein